MNHFVLDYGNLLSAAYMPRAYSHELQAHNFFHIFLLIFVLLTIGA